MADFVDDPNRTVMTLSGYAGTGKTSLMEMFADMMSKRYRPVKFSASTNKAAGVLGKRVGKKGFVSTTLDRLFGLRQEVDFDADAYDAKNTVTKLKAPKVRSGDVIIIDEASMINEGKYDIIMDYAKSMGLKIIFVGDEAQLAPVKESQVSKVFRDKENTDVFRLTIVERTGDNAILKEATALREGKNLSHESSFNSKGQGVAYISNKHKADANKVIAHYVKGLKDNPDYFRILAYHNDAVANYNQYVRNLLGYYDMLPRTGEPIMGYNNWGYIGDPVRPYQFINSEFYTVVEAKAPKTIKTKLPGASKFIEIEMDVVPIIIEDSAGEQLVVNFIDVIGNIKNR